VCKTVYPGSIPGVASKLPSKQKNCSPDERPRTRAEIRESGITLPPSRSALRRTGSAPKLAQRAKAGRSIRATKKRSAAAADAFEGAFEGAIFLGHGDGGGGGVFRGVLGGRRAMTRGGGSPAGAGSLRDGQTRQRHSDGEQGCHDDGAHR